MEYSNTSEIDVLKFAIENGILDLNPIYAQVEQMKKEQYLDAHNKSIWQGSKGYWYTHIGDDNKLVKRKSKEDLEQFIIDYYYGSQTPTFQECYMNWSKSKLNHGEIQKQTYDRYMIDYKRFFGDFGKNKISNITEDMLYDLILDTIHDQHLTAKAWSGMRTLILGTFKYAKRKRYTDISISTFMRDLDISRNAYRKRKFKDAESVFTDIEIQKIKNSMDKKVNILDLGILLAFETGLRCGELSSLEYSDLQDNVLKIDKTEVHYKQEDGSTIHVVRDSTKGKFDERNVVVTSKSVELIELVHKLNPDGKYLFEKDGKRIIGKCFTSRLYRLCKKSGIPQRSLHKCRKTYATKLANAGIDKKVICGQMGHTDFKTTENHYWFNNKTTQEVEQLIAHAMGEICEVTKVTSE